MKITDDCYPCLRRLIYQACELATSDPDIRSKAIKQSLELLDESFLNDKVSIQVAAPLHRLIRDITGNKDPYLEMKKLEVEISMQLINYFTNSAKSHLIDDIHLAVKGNTIDFFRTIEEIKAGMKLPVSYSIDHTSILEEKLRSVRQILYLADNTGEVIFDMKLANRLREFGEVTYVVKETPVQNDVSLIDVHRFGFNKNLPPVISTGTDTPGIDMDLASKEFKFKFKNADLILAKGMGFWETLSELPAEGKVFHLLKAKCLPVANSLMVPLDSYVALLR